MNKPCIVCGEPKGAGRRKYCDACASVRKLEYLQEQTPSKFKTCECGKPLELYRKKWCLDCAVDREAERMRRKSKRQYWEKNNKLK